MRKSSNVRVDGFETWLQTHGSDEERAAYNRSIVIGFLAIAGAKPVTDAHVATAIELATKAGLDTSVMAALGTLYVRFEGEKARDLGEQERARATPPPEPTPVKTPFFDPAELFDPVGLAGEHAEPVAPPEEHIPAPVAVAFRPQTAPVVAEAAAANDDEPLASLEPELAPATPTRPRASRRARVAKLVAAAVVAGLVGWLTWPSRETPPPIERLASIDLPISFPGDWRVAPTPESPSPHAKVAVVDHGRDQQAFVAVLPMRGAFAEAATGREQLLAAAREAELGASAHLASTHAVYYSEGCRVIDERDARCRGTATADTDSRVVITHVKLGASRAVVALFVSKLGHADRELDAIAASARP